MKPILSLLFALLFVVQTAFSQTARLQIIHNAPDPTVDIYVNGILLLNDFSFRTATPFSDVPAGIPLSIAIAPGNSMSVADAIATYPGTFENGKTYAVTASGVVGDPTTPFTLLTDDMAQEIASAPDKVAIQVTHGSPDAPAVDVAVRTGGTLVANLAYGEQTGYLEVAPGVYYLDVKPAGSSTIVATFLADLSGLGGAAARVFASGFLGGTPSFGLYAALPGGTVVTLPAAPVARVQVIHNSPSPTVDVYANDDLLIDDFEFRTATPYIFVPAGVDITLGIAPETSTSVNDTLVGFTVNLENGKTYAVTASGIVGDPTTPFTLIVDDNAREASLDPAQVDFNALHGATDAPAVDIAAQGVGDLVTNLAYGEFTGYLSVAPDTYILDVKPAGAPTVVASFVADLSGLAGGAARVFASGLLNGTPAFGLFAALPNGTVVEFPVYTPPTPTARLQVIHNSASPTVDIYANDDLLIDDFVYRTATPFIDVPANVLINVGVAPENSTSSGDAIAVFPVTFEEGKTYVVTASGIVGDPTTPFTLIVDDNAREASLDPAQVDFNALHGATDAPAVDIAAQGVGDLVTNLAYGEFTGYLSVAPDTYILDVKPAGAPTVVASFVADLSGLAGGAARVFASGLLNGTPAFGLFAALPNGTVVEFPVYTPPTPTARLQVIHNSASPTVDIYANDDLLIDDFVYRTATPFIDVPANVLINVGVAPENSTSAGDAIAVFPVTFEEGKTYVVTASGIVGDPTTPFTLIVDDNAREASLDPAQVDFNALHGATDAPAVDIAAQGVGDLVTNLAYGEFTGYLSVAPDTYILDVKPAGAPTVVASFVADLSGLAGGAARVFASGLLNGTPAFGLFAALPNGTVVEFPVYTPPTPTARLQVIHNSASPTVDIYANADLLIDDFVYRTATPFIEVPANVLINVGVAPENSTSSGDAIAVFPVTFEEGKTYVVVASGIVGNPTTPFTLITTDMGQETSVDPANVDVAVLHGSTDAPAVDVDATFVGNIITNASYGDLTPYFNLTPGVYDLAIRANGSPDVVASFRADISGLAGGAAVVFASGLLTSTPAFGLFAALSDGTVLELPATPTARVQVIHNSPEPTVDVYVGEQLLIDNFAFRTATPFVSLPSDRGFNIGIAPSNSTSAADAIAVFPVNLPTGATLNVVAGGIVGDPTTPFNLFIDLAQEFGNAGEVSISVFHGSPDAPAVDVDERLAGNLISNLAYGEFTPYVDLPAARYYLDVKAAGQPAIVATFLADLSGLGGAAARVFASGLLGGTPSFGLFAALADGTVIELPATPVARVQVIHNAPDPTVDVYINGDKAIDDFAFRSATPYLYLPAGTQLDIAVAPANSVSAADAIAVFPVTLDNGSTYTVMANGVVGDPVTPFTLSVNPTARERAETGTGVDLVLFHGSTDAPEVDVKVQNGPVVFDNIAYGEFSNYANVPAASYVLDITPAADNNTVVASYTADVSGLEGESATVFASGFFGGNQPGFGVWVALADGTTFPLPVYTSTVNLNSNLNALQIAPNPASNRFNLSFDLTQAESLRYRLRNLAGQLIQEEDLGLVSAGEYRKAVQIPALPGGLYLLELVSNKGISTAKLMIQQ
ncbi:MAG: DUF4397 domain-containing protein [Lewinellaceae bacterium]|nr:DUF4397 domain-containing protein [Lewinellaceae bacterium]